MAWTKKAYEASLHKEKYCLRCKKLFNPTSSAQKYCGSYIKKTGCFYEAKKIRNRIYDKKRHRPRKYPKIAICKKCGKEMNKRTGRQLYCKNCSPDINKKNKQKANKIYYQKNKEKLLLACEQFRKRYYFSPIGKYNEYKFWAKKLNRNFELTFEQFKEFWQKPCYYCGNIIKTIGLDKVDSKKGYTLDNIVSCCIVCNRMKRVSSKEDFIEQCKRIIEHIACRS